MTSTRHVTILSKYFIRTWVPRWYKQAVIVQVFGMCYISGGVSHGEGPWCAASAATHVRLRGESGDEIETWHAGGGRLSHLGGCVVERTHVCHSAPRVPHVRTTAGRRCTPTITVSPKPAVSRTSCAGATGAFAVPRVRWSSCPTFNSSKVRHRFVSSLTVKGGKQIQYEWFVSDYIYIYFSLWLTLY